MSHSLLIHATGLCALVLNTVALVCTCERSLRVRTGVAGMVWALNNFLMGANVAAALSVVSAGRTATSAATLGATNRLRQAAFGGFVALTLLVGAATWSGPSSLLMILASLMSTYAVFHLTGSALRWVMLAVSALWMVNAWSIGSWEQMAANVLSALAALWGMRRVAQARPA
jgi:hypothetical protein